MEAIKANAQRRAMDVLATIEDLGAAGLTSARQLAKALNEREILTPRGGRWHPASVQRVLGRAGVG